MTNEELDKLAAKDVAATRGPWEVWSSCSHLRITGPSQQDGGVLSAVHASDGVPVVAVRAEDMEAIVALRNAAPDLIRLARLALKLRVVITEMIEVFTLTPEEYIDDPVAAMRMVLARLDEAKADAKEHLARAEAAEKERDELKERNYDVRRVMDILEAERDELKAKLEKAEESARTWERSASMACETPADKCECSGCSFARQENGDG